jgi:hypothetical protein
MSSHFILVDADQPASPTEDTPFVVLMQEGQPVGLVAHDPFAGEPPPERAKTAAVLVVSREGLTLDSLAKMSRRALDEAPDAEGVILVDEKGEVEDVLPAGEVLRGLEGEEEVTKGRGTVRGFEPLPGPEPDVTASIVYTCPVPGCTNPDWTLWQKGMLVPPCPIHLKPRIRRLSEGQV